VERRKCNNGFITSNVNRQFLFWTGYFFYFNVEPLLSYKLNAFTIFYIGSMHEYRDLDPNRNDLTQTSRQFFMKFQYLVRI